jgi:tRNA nucleotidyltransferase/poly(A) polymerase
MKLIDVLNLIEEVSIKNKTSKPYACGGVVRDKVLNRITKINDLDITTGDTSIYLLGQEFYNKMSKIYNIEGTTAKDSHYTITFGNLKIDFSSNYIHPNITHILKSTNYSSLELETYSRDYTCNSLLSDLKFEEVLDITKRGKQDINSKVIDTCLDPSYTLPVQNNRSFRAAYLSLKLGFDIHPRVMKWIKENAMIVQNCKFKYLDEKIAMMTALDKQRTSKILKDTNMYAYIPQEIILRNDL